MPQVRDFLLPDLGEGLEEGEILEWLVEVGQTIELNQNLAVVETAKAAVEVPSPFAGKVVERFGEPGDTLQVGEPMVRIEVTDVADDVDLGGAAAPDEALASAEAAAVDGGGAGDEAPGGVHGEVASRSILDADEEPQPLVGYGQGKGGGTRRPRRGGKQASDGNGQAAAQASGQTQLEIPEGRPLAKPPVRKLAKDLGVDLSDAYPGSGPDGVITREDLHAAASAGPAAREEARPAEARPAAAPAAPAPVFHGSAGEKPVPGFRGRRPGEVEPIRGIRKRIVEKMELSRRDIPEATTSRVADVTRLWELRKELTEQARDEGFDVKITPFALVMRASILALRRFPTLNARIDREAGEISLLEHINLGVAVDTDAGLLVPNVKDAHTKSTLQLAIELHELADTARAGKLTPRQLTGGTFTVNNYGAFGNDFGDPIINHPESGILGVGAMRERPWVVDGELAIRRVCTFTLAFDHRVCDGGEAGRFITYVGDLCENPSRLLLHT